MGLIKFSIDHGTGGVVHETIVNLDKCGRDEVMFALSSFLRAAGYEDDAKSFEAIHDGKVSPDLSKSEAALNSLRLDNFKLRTVLLKIRNSIPDDEFDAFTDLIRFRDKVSGIITSSGGLIDDRQ